MSSKRITGLTERTNIASGDYLMLDNASLGSGKFDAAKLAEPPWELLNDITLDSESGINLTADSNGTPYNLLGVLIYVEYPANSTSIASGYARYRFCDTAGFSVVAETGKYTTNTAVKYKYIQTLKRNGLSFCYFTKQEALGGAGAWYIKSFGDGRGVSPFLGNIIRIMMPTEDKEPAGTKIKIYGQRAYS